MASMPRSADFGDTFLFLWCSKATEYASHQQLQRFVLSLSECELKHVIGLYLKHTIVSRRKNQIASVTTVHRATQHFKSEQEQTSTLQSVDESILQKMDKKYGKACSKQVIKRMQQKHAPHTHCLSISPQTLAYAFQFLSFRELCSIQPTCVYFNYLHATNPGQCHYHLELDRHFWLKAKRCKIYNLHLMRQFKSVAIEWMRNSNPLTYRHDRIFFECIAKRIIEQSRACWVALTIKEQWYSSSRNIHAYSILSFIMNSFVTLPITNLKWTRLCSGDSSCDVGNLQIKFPNLQRASFANSGPLTVLKLCHNVLPSAWHNLRSLHLDGSRINNLFAKHFDLLSKVSTLASLQELSVIAVLNNQPLTMYEANSTQNMTLQRLQLELGCRTETDNKDHSSRHILRQCFTVFGGLTHFSFSLHKRWPLRISQWRYSLLNSNSIALRPLQSLELSMTEAAFVRLLSCLKERRHNLCLNLHALSVSVVFETHTSFDDILGNDMRCFLQSATASNLLSVQLCVEWPDRRWRGEMSVPLWNVESHMLSVSNVLSHLPEKLQNFSWVSRYKHGYRSCAAINNVLYRQSTNKHESLELIAKLCNLSLKPGNLCSITLPVWLFHPLHRKYLDFYFGFNNKLLKRNETECFYVLCFT